MKKILTILIVVVAVVAVIGFTKNLIIEKAIEKWAATVTGLKLDIGSINVGIIKTIVHIKSLKLENPSGFSDRTMIDMPEIYIHYDLPAIIGGKIHLPELRLAIKEFVVVKNKNGELNLNSLRTVMANREGKTPSQVSPGKAPEIKIDLLKLSIGKAIYKDYSRGGTPYIREFNINLNESYTNVDDPYELANIIVVKALTGTSIANLANFDLNSLQGTVGDTLASAQKLAGSVTDARQAIAATQETATNTVKTAAETAKQAQGTVKQAAETVKDIFKSSFGSD